MYLASEFFVPMRARTNNPGELNFSQSLSPFMHNISSPNEQKKKKKKKRKTSNEEAPTKHLKNKPNKKIFSE